MSLRKSSNISNSTPSDATKKTASARRTPVIAAIAVVGAVLLTFTFCWLALRPHMTRVALGDKTFSALVAATPQTREQGLSDTAGLPADSAMLFVFPSDDTWQFWMKDMRYSLDIIWLDANKDVVYIAPGVTPASYPQTVYTPPQNARYVLEVNAGQVQQANITLGERATFTAAF